MKLIERLDKLEKVLDLETGYGEFVTISMIKGFINVEGERSIFIDLLKDTWINDYLLDENIDKKMLELNGSLILHESILFSVPIENFDDYFKSKKGIKKFKL